MGATGAGRPLAGGTAPTLPAAGGLLLRRQLTQVAVRCLRLHPGETAALLMAATDSTVAKHPCAIRSGLNHAASLNVGRTGKAFGDIAGFATTSLKRKGAARKSDAKAN